MRLYDHSSQRPGLGTMISCENASLTGGVWLMRKSRLLSAGEASRAVVMLVPEGQAAAAGGRLACS